MDYGTGPMREAPDAVTCERYQGRPATRPAYVTERLARIDRKARKSTVRHHVAQQGKRKVGWGRGAPRQLERGTAKGRTAKDWASRPARDLRVIAVQAKPPRNASDRPPGTRLVDKLTRGTPDPGARQGTAPRVLRHTRSQGAGQPRTRGASNGILYARTSYRRVTG